MSSRNFRDGRMIYAFLNECGRVKIGYSAQYHKRIESIENLGGTKIVKVFLTQKYTNAPIMERRIHDSLIEYKAFGEWFNIPFDMAISKINEIVSEMGDTASTT